MNRSTPTKRPKTNILVNHLRGVVLCRSSSKNLADFQEPDYSRTKFHLAHILQQLEPESLMSMSKVSGHLCLEEVVQVYSAVWKRVTSCFTSRPDSNPMFFLWAWLPTWLIAITVALIAIIKRVICTKPTLAIIENWCFSCSPHCSRSLNRH